MKRYSKWSDAEYHWKQPLAEPQSALRERLGVGKVVGKREHITDGSPRWCNPETTYTDPDTGASVIVHKEP